MGTRSWCGRGSGPLPTREAASAPWKGGDPAAPSGTATLLRLRPNRRSRLRRLPPQGLGHRLRAITTFVTGRAVCTRPGNVFTAALLICDYSRLQLHGPELQPPIRSETGFLGLAS